MTFGRFTALGGPDVEAKITSIVTDVQHTLRDALDLSEIRAVVLMGGYGRGEGGEDNGKPHNNLDVMIIARRQGFGPGLKTRADRALEPLVTRHGIGIDVGFIGQDALEKSQCLVMWYDMRFGHKHLLGDRDYLPALDQFNLASIAPSDVRNLIVNRGTLLVINDLILDKPALTESDKRTIIKHAIKAIIGYGDALLFFKGDYHWSYVQKKARMAARNDIAESVRALYDEAAAFRFKPDYQRFMDRDLRGWGEDLRAAFMPIHLGCEAQRLGYAALDWPHYLDRAFAHVLIEDRSRLRAHARKALAFAKSGRAPSGLGMIAQAGYRACRMRDRFPMLFPFVAYDLGDSVSTSIVAEALGVDSESDMRRAYLRAWGKDGDVNFGSVLRKLGLSLDGS